MMLTRILGYWFILVIALILALLIAAFFVPGWTGVIAVIIFCLSLTIAIFSIVQNQTKLYREKRISRTNLSINVLYELMGILLALILAGLLGRYIAEIAAEQLSNDLIKLIAGIVIGLLAGMGVGILVKRTWERLVKTSPES